MRRTWRDSVGGKILPVTFKFTFAAVVTCSVLTMISLTASAFLQVRNANLSDMAAAACDAQGNDTNESLVIERDINTVVTHKYTALAVANVSEAFALLLISAVFVVLVSLSVAIFRQAENVGARALLSNTAVRADKTAVDLRREHIVEDSMKAAAEQRKRLVMACVVVLVTFPARAAFDLLQAYAVYDVQYNGLCSPCGACQSTQYAPHTLSSLQKCNTLLMYVVRAWLAYTPEFQSLVVALSSPLPLTVSLWLITSAHKRAAVIQAAVQMAKV